MLKIIVNYQKINKFVIINKEQLQGSNQLLNLIKAKEVVLAKLIKLVTIEYFMQEKNYLPLKKDYLLNQEDQQQEIKEILKSLF